MVSNSSAVEQIKERVSITDLVGQRVKLGKSGRNLKGLCPFHSEKTPSFYVFPEKENYRCFGCGEHGDIFTWVMKTENVDFGEALKVLAERAGVELTRREVRSAEDSRRSRMWEINGAAARYYQAMLLQPQGAPALAYVAGRGLERSTIEMFQIGWAPDTWDALLNHLTSQGYTPEELAEVGLVVARESGGYYDRFRGRVTFPIRDARGNVIGFGGRAMGDAQPKYLNSSDSPVFSKGTALYAIDLARTPIKRDGVAIVVEGYMDAVVAHQAGIANVVAALGTALTEEHLLVLKRQAPRVVLALDADAAGDAAALRTLEVVRATYGKIALPVADRRGLVRLRYDQVLDVRVARLPEGQDPDDVIRASPERFKELIAQSRPILEVLIDSEVARAGQDNHARSLAADNVLDVIKDLPNPVLADQFTRLLSERIGVDYDALRSRLTELRRGARRQARAAEARGTAAPRAAEREVERLRDWLTYEEFVLRLLMVHPDHGRGILAELSGDDFYRTDARAVFEHVQDALAGPDLLGAEEIVQAIDGPLGDHARWIVAWGADLPTPDEQLLRHELTRCLVQLRILNYRRELALIGLRQRDSERDEGASDAAGDWGRVRELVAEVRELERQPGGELSRPWERVFRGEDALGPLRAVRSERRTAVMEPQEPPHIAEAAG
jgi:DNA primase